MELTTKELAQIIAEAYGRSWTEMGAYEREDYLDAARAELDTAESYSRVLGDALNRITGNG